VKKNLIFVIGSLNLGGTERHLASLLPRLAAKGWSVQVLTLADRGILADALEKEGILVNCVLKDWHTQIKGRLPSLMGRLLQSVVCVCSLSSRLKVEKNAIIHFFLPEAYILGMFSAMLARFPGSKIMSRRSLNHYQQRRPLLGWIESKLHSKTTAISGNSLAVLKQLEEEKIPLAHLRLIYNGVDTEQFHSAQSRVDTRKKLKIEKDALVIIMVANLIPYKGHRDLFNALYQVKHSLPTGWRLLCVGQDRNDGFQVELISLTKELGLTENVLLLGSRNDIPDLLLSADIGVLCSHEEGFSNAVLEGMAAGLPMVVTNVGGNAEAILDKETGYVVEPRNPKALAAAIIGLVENPEIRSKFGRKAKQRVEQHFSWGACVKAYETLYENA